MENKLIIPLSFGIFGFIISFLVSLISGSSIVGVLTRSLISTLILGGLGYLLVYLLEKFNNEYLSNNRREKIDSTTSNSINTNANFENIKSKANSKPDFSNKYSENSYTDESFSSNVENETGVSASNLNLQDEENSSISYEDLFSKLSNEEKGEKSEKEENIPNKINEDIYKKSVIDEMKKEKEKESVEIEFSSDTEIVEGDSELNPNSISADDAAKISATSKMNSIVGEVKGIDDKFIYFSKGSKIENKPEKIAKVIKEMLKNE